MLNQIPEVYCTNESDVVWLLYQVDQGSPELTEEIGTGYGGKTIEPFVRHPLDVGSAGAVHTLRAIRHYDGESVFTQGTWRERYEAIQNMEWLHIRQNLTKRPFGKAIRNDLLRKTWETLEYVGDKMPTQVADPDVFNWWISRFPETRFIHLIRDPRRVVASMMKLGFNTWWREEADKVFAQWAAIERWAIDIERKIPDQVIRVRQEDMAANPNSLMGDMVTFLGLQKKVTFPARKTTQTAPIGAPDDPYVREVMEEYGYG